jgi:hypothetical protein
LRGAMFGLEHAVSVASVAHPIAMKVLAQL